MTVNDIGAQWLNSQLEKLLAGSDHSAEDIVAMEKKILDILGQESYTNRDCEKKLF